MASLAVAGALALAAPARAANVEISWDRDLAFEWDRDNYEKTLGAIVRSSHDEVSAWLGWTLSRTLQVRVLSRARYEGQFGTSGLEPRGALLRRHHLGERRRAARRLVRVHDGARDRSRLPRSPWYWGPAADVGE
jgi:hypothetical protein